jgi:hypothetical protein
MKRLLQVGFALGLVGTIAVAYAFPWFEYERYLSKTSVVANGGRVEQFMVRLPADQIESTIEVPGSDTGQRLSHFKLRDAEGNVIGLAAKHELTLEGARETAWLLTIPSRGTIALAGWSPLLGSIESIVADRGLAPGQSADPALSIDFAAPAQSIVTTGEFEGISFELVETWEVTGVDEEGNIRGTLQLNTIGRQSS